MEIGEVGSVNSKSYSGQGSPKQVARASEASVNVKSSDSESKASTPVVDEYTTTQKNSTDEKENKNSNMSSSLKNAVSKINAASQNCEAVFGIHEATNRVMIKMVDKETKETIKEFPAEETLDLIAKAWELAGIMVDEKR